MNDWDADMHTVLSFRARLHWLRKYVSLMGEDTLASLFISYWCKKRDAWACGCHSCMKNERRASILLNVCWDGLVKRGWSQLHVIEEGEGYRLYGKHLAGGVQLAV